MTWCVNFSLTWKTGKLDILSRLDEHRRTYDDKYDIRDKNLPTVLANSSNHSRARCHNIEHRRPKLSLWVFYLYANVPWHSYRRRLLLHNDRVSLRETWLWSLAFEGVMLQRFEFTKVCMGKNANINFSRNFDIFAIKMTYLNALLSFLLSSCFSARSVAF